VRISLQRATASFAFALSAHEDALSNTFQRTAENESKRCQSWAIFLRVIPGLL
jgi:hypothetical protein